MKRFIFLTSLLAFIMAYTMGQNSSIVLSFNADNNGEIVLMDSLKIQNLTQEAEIMLYAPVTDYEILITGVGEYYPTHEVLLLSQNHPNPFNKETFIDIQIKDPGNLQISICNVLGEHIIGLNQMLASGNHRFSFSPGKQACYFLSAHTHGQTQTIKLISNSCSNNAVKLNYEGLLSSGFQIKAGKSNDDFPFAIGDQLLLVGYYEEGESGLSDHPEMDAEYTLQFATNIPCITEPTVDYGGQIYNTVQIRNQCWFKENLNVGDMIDAPNNQTNNEIIEKYCFGNDLYYCTILGGLYFWNELMNYNYETGSQGICPSGWHIPTDLDWNILEGAVDSEFGIGNPEWEGNDWRGADAGGMLKQIGTEWWEYPNTGALDAFGFTSLPAGYFVQGDFWGGGYKGYFYTSDTQYKYYRDMDWNQKMIKKGDGTGDPAFSVRCIKDDE